MIKIEVLRKAWEIAWPLIVAEAVDSVLSITDTFFVSRLGDEATAAVGLAGYASWVFFVSVQLFYMGVIVLAAQAYGARDFETASRVTGESVSASLILTLPMTLLGYRFSSELMSILGGDVGVNVLTLSSKYFSIRVFGLPVLAAIMTLGATYRAVGLTRPVMIATVAGAALNIVLDPILIFGLGPFPKLGIEGAAWATVISFLLDLALHFAFLPILPFKVKVSVPKRQALKAGRVGLPPTVERLAFSLGNMAYISVIARCGKEALAAHTIGIRIESFAFLPAFALSVAASSLVGQEVGRREVLKAKEVGWEVSKFTAFFMAFAGGVVVLISPFAPRVFTSTPSILWLSTIYLILAGVSEPPLGLIMGLAGSIRGAGNTLVPTVMNLLGLYLFRVLPAFTLPRIMPPGMCVVGAWISMDLDLFMRAIMFLLLYKKKFEKLARLLVK